MFPIILETATQYSDGQSLFLFLTTFSIFTMIAAAPFIFGVLVLILLYYLFVKE